MTSSVWESKVESAKNAATMYAQNMKNPFHSSTIEKIDPEDENATVYYVLVKNGTGLGKIGVKVEFHELGNSILIIRDKP